MNWIVGLFYETTNDDWNSPWGDPTNYDYQESFALAYWEQQTQYGFSPGFAPNAEWIEPLIKGGVPAAKRLSILLPMLQLVVVEGDTLVPRIPLAAELEIAAPEFRPNGLLNVRGTAVP